MYQRTMIPVKNLVKMEETDTITGMVYGLTDTCTDDQQSPSHYASFTPSVTIAKLRNAFRFKRIDKQDNERLQRTDTFPNIDRGNMPLGSETFQKVLMEMYAGDQNGKNDHKVQINERKRDKHRPESRGIFRTRSLYEFSTNTDKQVRWATCSNK